MTMAPQVKRISANIIRGLRPSLSDAVPENREPIAAPTSARLTIRDLYSFVMSGKSLTK